MYFCEVNTDIITYCQKMLMQTEKKLVYKACIMYDLQFCLVYTAGNVPS
jgi:hypothetical protein